MHSPGEDFHAIINPAAANGRAGRRWPSLASQFRAVGLKIHEHWTNAPGHAQTIATDLMQCGCTEIIVAGGDGTIHEVANGVMLNGEGIVPAITLTVLSLGTGCDFARNLGILRASNPLALLLSNEIRPIDLGIAAFRNEAGHHQRCFLNAADVGLGARVAQRVNRGDKRLGGLLTYATGALREIGAASALSLSIAVDDRDAISHACTSVIIANGVYYGGGMRPAPNASMQDGQLDLIVLGVVSRVALAFNLLPRVYFGRHLAHKSIHSWRCTSVTIQSPSQQLFALDGETFEFTELQLSVRQTALHVRVPKL